jgi:hypothetical protein
VRREKPRFSKMLLNVVVASPLETNCVENICDSWPQAGCCDAFDLHPDRTIPAMNPRGVTLCDGCRLLPGRKTRSTKMLAKVSIGTSSDGGELGTCSEIRGQFHASPAAAMLAADAAIALRMLTLARNRPSSASVAISDARRLPGCLPHLGPMQRRVSPEH